MKLYGFDFDAVIFDLDGTLVDSLWVWRDIDIAFLARFGKEIPDDLQRCIDGMSFSEVAVYFKERFELPISIEEIKAAWNDMAMDQYKNHVKAKPGVARFLSYLKENAIPVAIASSNSKELIDASMEGNGLAGSIDAIAFACEVAQGKPAPDVYLLAAKRLKTAPSRCLVFEDIPEGIEGAHNAGMPVVAVWDPYSEALWETFCDTADAKIKDYNTLLES